MKMKTVEVKLYYSVDTENVEEAVKLLTHYFMEDKNLYFQGAKFTLTGASVEDITPLELVEVENEGTRSDWVKFRDKHLDPTRRN